MGHFPGAFDPNDEQQAVTVVKQGVYCFAPSGVFLASIYSNDPEEVAQTLQKALEKWETLKPEARLAPEPIDPSLAAPRPGGDQGYPEDGLVLFVAMRDLPRTPPQDESNASSWNKDYAWFTRDEARSLLPSLPKAGDRHPVPDALARRLARCHFVDCVRNLDMPYEDADVKKVSLTATVTKVDGDRVHLDLEGASHTDKEGVWPINGAEDHGAPKPQKRGIQVRILGRAVYNLHTEAFESFEMVALGKRWGATQWNGRTDDLGENGIGYAFRLAGKGPVDRMIPWGVVNGVYR